MATGIERCAAAIDRAAIRAFTSVAQPIAAARTAIHRAGTTVLSRIAHTITAGAAVGRIVPAAGVRITGVQGAGLAVVTANGGELATIIRLAEVLRAGVGVVALQGHIDAAVVRIAGVVGAFVIVIAVRSRAGRASAQSTHFPAVAHSGIVARSAVGHGHVRASAAWIARVRRAGVLVVTVHWDISTAAIRIARILRAGIGIVAVQGRVSARSGIGVANVVGANVPSSHWLSSGRFTHRSFSSSQESLTKMHPLMAGGQVLIAAQPLSVQVSVEQKLPSSQRLWSGVLLQPAVPSQRSTVQSTPSSQWI